MAKVWVEEFVVWVQRFVLEMVQAQAADLCPFNF